MIKCAPKKITMINLYLKINCMDILSCNTLLLRKNRIKICIYSQLKYY